MPDHAPNGGDSVVMATGAHSPKNLNHYPNLAYKFACSERFGELSPFLKYVGTDGDKNVILYSGSSVDSMSLHAPILQDIRHKKEFYVIDKKGILPHCYEFIKNQPSHGDDIDASRANCLINLYGSDVVASIENALESLCSDSALWDSTNGALLYDDQTYTFNLFIKWLRSFAFFNELFAPDSLFAKFRIPLADILDPNGGDKVFSILDECWKYYHDILDSMQGLAAPNGTNVGDIERNVQIWFKDSDDNVILRKVYNFESVEGRMAFYYDFLDNSNIVFKTFDGSNLSDSNIGEAMVGLLDIAGSGTPLLYTYWQDELSDNFAALFDCPNAEEFINIEAIIAYQLSCFEYFTNDLVDYVYSAKIYRQIWESYAFDKKLIYDYNGVKQPYDGFSAITIESVLDNITSLYEYDLFMSLITHKRSLRYIDYFVGGRPTPLAAADTQVTVNNNVASAIDITQSAIFTRFKLFVQRVGRKAENYLEKILHGRPRVDICCPVRIGGISELIYKEEVQNTASDQLELDNSRTATLKAHNRQFAFDTDIDEDSIIIGISSYEITRFYDRGLDPFALKVDRFDMFNPMLQYLGDQPILQSELNAGLPVADYFAYTNRNMEYKTGVDYCAGAFRKELKDWIFVQPAADRDTVISPDFIRAHQTELDRYYVALTALSSYGRYHFICKYNNVISAYRNMIFAPLLKF